jgi:hypothetical protein
MKDLSHVACLLLKVLFEELRQAIDHINELDCQTMKAKYHNNQRYRTTGNDEKLCDKQTVSESLVPIQY